jgi:hypothetical protein
MDDFLVHPTLSPVISSTSLGFSPYTSYAHDPSNPFDVILPRGLLYFIIDLYFDYIYALIPCVHRPSFLADLYGGRETRPNEEEWTAMVLVIVSATLVQLPRAFVPLPRKEVRALVDKITAVTTRYIAKEFQESTIARCEFRRRLREMSAEFRYHPLSVSSAETRRTRTFT